MKKKKAAPKKKILPVFVKAKNKRVYKFHNFFIKKDQVQNQRPE